MSAAPYIVQAFTPGSERKFCKTLDEAKRVATEMVEKTLAPHHIFQVVGTVELVTVPKFTEVQ